MKKWILFTLFLAGCTVGPNYKPPVNVISDEWSSSPEAATCEEPVERWWEVFKDPLLTCMIEMAALNNKDILVAEANIYQARALRTVAASKLFPMIDADFNATKTYFSKNGPIFAIGPAEQSLPGITNPINGLPFSIQIPQIQPLYNALFDVTWEIDVFGKTRRAIEASDANIGSTIENKHEVLITVLAEVGRNYIELRRDQKLVALLKRSIDLLEKNYNINEESYKKGYTNSITPETVRAQYNEIKAALPLINAQIFQAIYTISLLTGNIPEALLDNLIEVKPLPKPEEEVIVGLRSDLLRRRPDVRMAERNLAAATANVGVAVASFFPTFRLLGDVGFQSLKLSTLFKGSSKTWALGGDVDLPIFEGGRLIGNLRANEAATTAAGFSYQEAVLTALQEAESSLMTYKESLKTYQMLEEALDALQKIDHINDARFKGGLINYPSYVTAALEAIIGEELAVAGQAQTLLNLVTLYKALGGGWAVDFCAEHQ